ncbi:TetR/AcrR family transcriptional regulator [Saccharopolyspora flava]|uniref:TetR/AcrR family transcriptional regulator n=1 Tax=Saccharopolyspora flava TaxID=95161 RepID=UPI000B856E49|nr:TetR/AcrR family transcriptional regulator [Saccharopolyspora flava]
MSSPNRPLRVDAARNREHLLAAAEAEFAERGLSVSVADIALRAGIAKGTVFRHFASKEDLIASIVSGHLTALTGCAERLADAADPGDALWEFLSFAADQRHRHNIDFLWAVSEGDARVTELRDRLFSGIERLVVRAHQVEAIRSDVTASDVYLLMCAPVHAVENLPNPSPDLWKRYLGIIFDGLRPEGANPLSEPAPTVF